ncbi:XkdF-like putative serine protease domain-containing protein [Anaerovorax sp. IOR16]|uniref:XkdF-like putative serine protease domain-containing protein n=1 Tax=Anaerovorax sp. IOR16 TaxID=2773458 RepID=UPI0019D1A76E|nr:XkdF-like putative serine protease domain-containing protein [Anaerovorax sp. IOR16]
MSQIKKAFEITDAKISFVSLVDKAANQKQFLITKSKNKDERGFATLGKIVKSDSELHHITGVVYEPLVKDAHDNYMTEEEIQKAAYWFAKNGDKVDLQHDFEECDSCTVVETWVAKADFSIEDELITKGTWLMTVEIADDDIWEKVEKKEITGFSMGGVGKYSTEDVDVSSIEKGANVKMEDKEKKGIFKQLAEMMGFSVVEKGAMADEYNERIKSSNFWEAINTLTSLIAKGRWDYRTDRYVYDFEEDEENLKEVLTDFSNIITDILSQKSITKALLETAPQKPITKAGKKMSGKNQQKLTEIMESLSAFAEEFKMDEEETEVKKDEIQKMIDEAVTKALNPTQVQASEPEVDITGESITKMVEAAVAKATAPTSEPASSLNPEPSAGPVGEEQIEKMISATIEKALAPILKAKGIPSNLNAEGEPIEKNESHYLTGIL